MSDLSWTERQKQIFTLHSFKHTHWSCACCAHLCAFAEFKWINIWKGWHYAHPSIGLEPCRPWFAVDAAKASPNMWRCCWNGVTSCCWMFFPLGGTRKAGHQTLPTTVPYHSPKDGVKMVPTLFLKWTFIATWVDSWETAAWSLFTFRPSYIYFKISDPILILAIFLSYLIRECVCVCMCMCVCVYVFFVRTKIIISLTMWLVTFYVGKWGGCRSFQLQRAVWCVLFCFFFQIRIE